MDPILSNPPEWVTAPVRKQNRERLKRNLYDNENYESYLVDSNGNQYEPYSMAWRYLGVYIDCDVQQYSDGANNIDESNVYRRLARKLFGSTQPTAITSSAASRASHRRDLGSDSGDNSDDDDDCSRKVLWAAYYDPKYRGNSIGEYQFYDRVTESWDTSTCQVRRCAKMDCHASRSHFKLIGVFKEADGLVDFAEQLFKHEGYCIWDGDKENDEDESGSGSGDGNGDGNGDDEETSDYEFMYYRQDYVAQGCNQMYLTDDDGNTVYRGLQPLPGGNITDGLYTDEDCTEQSAMSFGDYIIKWYVNYYYDEEQGQEIAERWSQNINRWNQLMTDYHVCQPCRAYNRIPTYDDDYDDDDRRRHLDQDDGGGAEEQWGYNCYDDAGYRNCNQCYKFETKTDMEPASVEDLERASKQGTILAVKVDGVVYGRGGIDWHDFEDDARATARILGPVLLLGILLVLGYRYRSSILHAKRKVRSRRFQKSLREAFMEDDEEYDDDDGKGNADDNPSVPSDRDRDLWSDELAEDRIRQAWSDDKEEELAATKRLVEDQRREIDRMKLELNRRNSTRSLEREPENPPVAVLSEVEGDNPDGETELQGPSPPAPEALGREADGDEESAEQQPSDLSSPFLQNEQKEDCVRQT